MTIEDKHLRLAYWGALSVALSFIASLAGYFFDPYGYLQNLFYQMAAVLETVAFAAFAIKAARTHDEVPAVGFTVLAIAQGVFFSAIHLKKPLDYEEGVAGVLFLIPSMIMICEYTLFPRWLRIMGLVSILPFMYVLVWIYSGSYTPNNFLENSVFVGFQASTLFWAWYIIKDERTIARKLKSSFKQEKEEHSR